MKHLFFVLSLCSTLCALGQNCAEDATPPVFTGEILPPENFPEESFSIHGDGESWIEITIDLNGETIPLIDIDNFNWFEPVFEDDCSENVSFQTSQYQVSGSCGGSVIREYSCFDEALNFANPLVVLYAFSDTTNPACSRCAAPILALYH